MSFCATCGRARTGTARFCAGCGTEFRDAPDTPAPDAGGTAVPAGESPPDAGQTGGEPTRWDTRVDLPGGTAIPPAAPDTQPSAWPPVAAPAPEPAGEAQPSWAQPGYGAAGSGPGEYGPVPQDPGAFGPRPPRRGGSGLLITVVIVVVLAVGGGAFALVSSLASHSGGTASGTASSAPPVQPASSAAPASPTPASSSSSPSRPASPRATTVAISAAAAGNPAAPRVQALLERYFSAINAHDYPAYSSLLDAQMRQMNPPSKFASGYATTRDSAETLTGISGTGAGGLAATVSFTSHQSPADSINNSSCTAWTITLYLRPQGSGYLIGAPPAGYQPIHSNCP